MRTLLSSVTFSLLLTISQAQTVRPSLSAVALFPNAYSAKEADAFSFLSNQAALANTSTLTAGIYGERRFLLQELAFYQAALAVPTPSGQFGLTGSYMGFSSHYEARAGLAYARKLSGLVDLGAQFNYQAIKVAGYGAAAAVYVETGALLHLHKQVHLGLHVSNPTSAAIGKEEKDLLPLVCTAGLGYEASPRFFIVGELQKTLHRGLEVNAGMQYRLDERLRVRAGFRSETSSWYLAAGFGLKALRLDAVFNVHPQLGLTPGLQVIFNPKEREP